MMLDPFYGVFETSVWIAKWLNRILLLLEIAAIGIGFYAFYDMGGASFLGWVGLVLLSFLAIHVFNILVRAVWNIVLAFVYGTTDADLIVEEHDAKVARKLRRQRERRTRKAKGDIQKGRSSDLSLGADEDDLPF